MVGGNLIDTRGRRAVIVPSMFIMAASAALLVCLAFFVGPRVSYPVVPFLFLTGLLAGAPTASCTRPSPPSSWT